jgi:hypothetical protein
LARGLLNFSVALRWTTSDKQKEMFSNMDPTTPRSAAPSGSEQNGSAKKNYKSVPENCRVLSDSKYHKVVADLEAILLDISTDGVGINTPDGKISASSLKNWAAALRNALETLSKAQ